MTPNRRIITLTLAVAGLLVFSGQGCPFLLAPFAPLEGNDAGEVIVEITLAPFIQPGVSTPLLIRAGIAQDDGSVDYSQVIDIDLAITNGTTNRPFGTIDADGFFESEVTPNPGFDQLTVFATATANISGATATVTAQASPLILNLPITIESRDSHLFAEAQASAGPVQTRDSPGLIRTDPDDYDTFNREITATIAAQDFVGVASGSSTATQVSFLLTDGEGFLSGGTVQGTCNSSAAISDPLNATLIGESQANSGLNLRFTINGDKAYILTINGTFTGKGEPGTGAHSVGQYRVLSVGSSDVSSVVDFDGGNLLVSDSVILPPGGSYRLDIGHGCNATAFGLGSSEAESSMDFTFSFAPAE